MFRNGVRKIVIDYYVWDNVRKLCFLRDPETISELVANGIRPCLDYFDFIRRKYKNEIASLRL